MPDKTSQTKTLQAVESSDLFGDLEELAEHHKLLSSKLMCDLEAIPKLMEAYKGKNAEDMEEGLETLSINQHRMHTRYESACRKALEILQPNKELSD